MKNYQFTQKEFLTVIISIAVFSGIFFRFYDVDQKVFWHDEVYTQIFASGYRSADWQKIAYTGEVFSVRDILKFRQYNPEKTIFSTISALAQDEPQNPPLYFILARFWMGVFGNDNANLRLLSVWIGLFCLPAVYWLCLELFRKTEVAWLGISLMAVSPFFIIFSQEARSYILWTLFSILSSASLLRALRRTDSQGIGSRRFDFAWIYFILFTAASLYTTLSSGSVIISQILFVFIWENFKISRNFLLFTFSLIIAGLLFLPWLIVLFIHLDATIASMAWSSVIQVPRFEILYTYAMNFSRVITDFSEGSLWSYIAAAAGNTLAVLAFIYFIRKKMFRETALLFAFAAVPLVFFLLPDLIFGGIRSLASRYFTPTWIAVISALAFLSGRNLRAAYGIVIFCLLISAGIAGNWINHNKESLRTKSVSNPLPEAERILNQNQNVLVICNREVHHPGNILALSSMLRSDIDLQFPRFDQMFSPEYKIPEGYKYVYLFGANLPFRNNLIKNEKIKLMPIMEGIYVQIWKVQFHKSL
ncbi:MAG: glycosyltransferase family 39 protein [Spirochaetia bacterium]|nr:glycosyltransferase family 39 protein [Spirochaetia bacterium]